MRVSTPAGNRTTEATTSVAETKLTHEGVQLQVALTILLRTNDTMAVEWSLQVLEAELLIGDEPVMRPCPRVAVPGLSFAHAAQVCHAAKLSSSVDQRSMTARRL